MTFTPLNIPNIKTGNHQLAVKLKNHFFKAVTLSSITAISIFTLPAQANTQNNTETFDNFVFFGDSLSDSGYYTNYAPNLGKFTTGSDKVWTEFLAESYGSQAIANSNNVKGNNYAAGGALSYVSKPTDELRNLGVMSVPMPSVNSQMENHLADNDNKVNPDALYSVWIGANDMLGVSEMSPAPSAMEAAGIMGKSAITTAESVQNLSNRGAKYILVPNLPDVGLSPNATISKTTQESTALANFYNNTLYSALDSGTANVIPLDTFSLLQEVVQSPTEYGFNEISSDVTQLAACGFDPKAGYNSSLTCNAESAGYIFADGVHPTGPVHNAIAEYARSVMDAPAKYAQVGNVIKQSGAAENLQVNRRLDQLSPNQNNVWIEAGVSKPDGQSYDSDSVGTNVMVGADFGMETSNTGMYIRTGKDDIKVDSLTNFDLDQAGFGVYHSHDIKGYGVNLYAGIDKYDINWQRSIKLGTATRTHMADGGARRDHIGLQVQHPITVSKSSSVGGDTSNGIVLTPYVGALSQTVTVNSLYEDNAKQSTSMTFDKFEQDSLRGEFGVKARYPVNDKFDVVADAQYNHEFSNNNDTGITANLQSVSSSYKKGFSLPVDLNQDDSFALSLGVNGQLNDRIDFQIGATTQGTDSENMNTGAYLGVNSKF